MIEAQKLTKIFDGKKALNGVDIKINSGSIYGLVGSNGSGKSTLLRLISGIYKPDGGSITIDGNSVFNNAEIKAGISYLGDTPYFLPGATINETAKFYRSMYKNFDNALFHRLLEIFPLDYKAKIAAMSKGMQRQNIDPVKGLLPALRGHVQLQRAAEHRRTEPEVHPVNVVCRRMRQQAQQRDHDQHFFHLHHLSGYSAGEVAVLCRKTGRRSNSRNQKSACGG